MGFYRKKPVVIEAELYSDENMENVINLLQKTPCDYRFPATGGLEIKTLESTEENWHHATAGDWIIRGVKGECYACKPDIFEATYELALQEG